MSEFTLYEQGTAPEGSKTLLAKVHKSTGFVPNLFRVMAGSSALLEAYLTLSELANKTNFNKDELTAAWQAINRANDCHYCVPAHVAVAKQMGVDEGLSQALAKGETVRDRKLDAIVEFAQQLVVARGHVEKIHLEAFYAAGYEEKHVLDLIFLIGQKTMSNYTNHLANTPVDDAFKAS
ncbi:MAG: carboxymuconolactone decarboxylase family protein [Gammaproteobacteria bacterium]|nr:carboxymuconolactone decarboxylase family protein [Gammaproteobacteria bacterium]